MAVTAILFFLPAIIDKQMNAVSEHEEFVVSEEAKQLHRTLVIGDWHADSALWNRDLVQKYDYGHVDIPRMQQGNIDRGQRWAPTSVD